jgi:hypothetical protein
MSLLGWLLLWRLIAGYRLEVEPTQANSARFDQFDDNNIEDPNGNLFARHSYMYLSSKKYGEVRLGLTNIPVYNITKDTNATELEDTIRRQSHNAEPLPATHWLQQCGRIVDAKMVEHLPLLYLQQCLCLLDAAKWCRLLVA